jgi:NAD(P)-dependent dehydrogenase (short-subunit alcohol dehydrogenase family)
MDHTTGRTTVLHDKVCVVTGAGAGIGRETAIEMARRGARAVVAADLRLDDAEATARLVTEAGTEGLGVAVDVSDPESVQRAMDDTAGRFGGLDVLHNNAGIHESTMTDRPRLEDIAPEVFDRVYQVNLRGVWLCIKHAARHMRARGGGSIVNASSLSGLTGFEGAGVYCATKGAVILLTKVAALELADAGIRCNCYCPAATDTAMAHGYIDSAPDPAKAAATLVDSHLVPRMATPLEIARLVCFLASDEASFITGAAVPIDGGATAWRGLRSA